jgi:hypothetical protein
MAILNVIICAVPYLRKRALPYGGSAIEFLAPRHILLVGEIEMNLAQKGISNGY